jgi:predicted Holliday junction resolvase-like endonuclease
MKACIDCNEGMLGNAELKCRDIHHELAKTELQRRAQRLLRHTQRKFRKWKHREEIHDGAKDTD